MVVKYIPRYIPALKLLKHIAFDSLGLRATEQSSYVGNSKSEPNVYVVYMILDH